MKKMVKWNINENILASTKIMETFRSHSTKIEAHKEFCVLSIEGVEMFLKEPMGTFEIQLISWNK